MNPNYKKFPEKTAKVFFFILYAEDSFDWVRRQDNRFAIDKVKFMERFKPSGTRTYKWVDAMFHQMQNVGWISSYRHDKLAIRFTVRLPNWLTLAAYAKVTERYVPQSRHYGEDESANKVMGQQFRTEYQRDTEKEAYQQLKEELEAYENSGPLTIEEATQERGDM